MLQTIGQVKKWVLDKIELHEMSIAGSGLFSPADISHRGAVAAYKMLLDALEGHQEPQGEVLVDMSDPEVLNKLRAHLDGPESTYESDADVADDPRR